MGWARGLAVMTPRLHRVDRGFDSHRAHHNSLHSLWLAHWLSGNGSHLAQAIALALNRTSVDFRITIQDVGVSHSNPLN